MAAATGGAKAVPFVQVWESRSALTDDQHELVAAIGKFAAVPALPAHLVGAEDSGGAAGQLHARAKGTDAQEELDIENMQQFYMWFQSLEAEANQLAFDPYSVYLRQISEYAGECERILQEIDASLEALTMLEEQHVTVLTKTGELHQACEELFAQQQRLAAFSASITEKLENFNESDRAAAKLNSPTLSILDPSFADLLKRLDECIAFVAAHSTYKEASTYYTKLRFQQGRALTMVKNYIVSALRTATNQIVQQNQAGKLDPSQGTEQSKAYLKFRTLASKLQPLCQELESRASVSSAYATLLSDCHYCYAQQRKQLISPLVSQHIYSLTRSHDLPNMVRSGCSYLLRICSIEEQLFENFFAPSPAAVRGLLEGFASEMYGAFRPLFIQTTDIDVLCTIAEILKSEILDDQLSRQSETSSQWMHGVVRRMVADIQERLTYLAQVYVLDSISTFKPADKDIDYPNILMGVNADSTPNTLQDLYFTWYPTLKRTLVCLSKLYRCVEPSIFEGLAQEAVSECSNSLFRAASLINANKGFIDAQLFLIRHLLILREQITPFDIEFLIVERNLDFTPVKTAFSNLLRGIRGQALTSLLSPRLVESQVDSKKLLEKALVDAIELFINTNIQPLLAPLTSFLATANAFIASSPTAPLREQPFATPERVRELVDSVSEKIEPTLSPVVGSMRIYLTNRTNLNKTLIHLKEKILHSFGELNELLERHYQPQDRMLLSAASTDTQRRRLEAFFTAVLTPAVSRQPSQSTPPTSLDGVANPPPPSAAAVGEEATTAATTEAAPPTSSEQNGALVV